MKRVMDKDERGEFDIDTVWLWRSGATVRIREIYQTSGGHVMAAVRVLSDPEDPAGEYNNIVSILDLAPVPDGHEPITKEQAFAALRPEVEIVDKTVAKIGREIVDGFSQGSLL